LSYNNYNEIREYNPTIAVKLTNEQWRNIIKLLSEHKDGIVLSDIISNCLGYKEK
jgi:aspartate/tyrosine/aromatic aminotransferase